MVAFNSVSKLCVVMVFGLSATATSTEVAQEQPKKESFLSRFFGKNERPATKSQDGPEPPKYSVEWYLLPKEENRKELRDELPCDLCIAVPEDCNKPLLPVVEKRVRKFLSLSEKDQRLLRLHSYC